MSFQQNIILCAVFFLSACHYEAIFYTDPLTRNAAPTLVRAWQGGLFSERGIVLVKDKIEDTEKDLAARKNLKTVIVGSWAKKQILEHWLERWPEIRFCVLMPKEEVLPKGVVALLPDRLSGWPLLISQAMVKTAYKANSRSVVILPSSVSTKLWQTLDQAWNSFRPTKPLTFLQLSRPSDSNWDTLYPKIPSDVGFVLLLAGIYTPKLSDFVQKTAPYAIEFPAAEQAGSWSAALVLDEKKLTKLFSQKPFPPEEKEILLPLKTQMKIW